MVLNSKALQSVWIKEAIARSEKQTIYKIEVGNIRVRFSSALRHINVNLCLCEVGDPVTVSREIVTAVSKVEATFLNVITCLASFCFYRRAWVSYGSGIASLNAHFIYRSSGTFPVFMQQHHTLIRASRSCKTPNAAIS